MQGTVKGRDAGNGNGSDAKLAPSLGSVTRPFASPELYEEGSQQQLPGIRLLITLAARHHSEFSADLVVRGQVRASQKTAVGRKKLQLLSLRAWGV